MNARHAPSRASGFTLIEVLVALFIMAIMAAMAFRGVEALVNAKSGAQTTTDRTLKLNTGMAQFEMDLSQMVNTELAFEPLSFDGGTLRITRQTSEGIQLVLWTLQDGRWQRWASPSVTHVAQLQDLWQRSQQWTAIQNDALVLLDKVTGFQVYFYRRGSGNSSSSGSWTNAQSSGDVATRPVNGPQGGGNPAPLQAVSPNGIRIVLTLDNGNGSGGSIVREKELPPV